MKHANKNCGTSHDCKSFFLIKSLAGGSCDSLVKCNEAFGTTFRLLSTSSRRVVTFSTGAFTPAPMLYSTVWRWRFTWSMHAILKKRQHNWNENYKREFNFFYYFFITNNRMKLMFFFIFLCCPTSLTAVEKTARKMHSSVRHSHLGAHWVSNVLQLKRCLATHVRPPPYAHSRSRRVVKNFDVEFASMAEIEGKWALYIAVKW